MRKAWRYLLLLAFQAIGFASPFQPLSETPRIFLIEKFLTTEECDQIIERAKPHLAPSATVSGDSAELIVHQGRTSRGMFFPTSSSDPLISSIEKRIALLTSIPEENGEGLQVLCYGPGQEYQPHHDYFDPHSPGECAFLKQGGQRIVTFLIYLNSPEEGGETAFPLAHLEILPVKGNAVFFYNCTPDQLEDPLTLHAGAPVIKGEKWIATKWLRQRPFR
jgi:prolyl 4-hydroxylase